MDKYKRKFQEDKQEILEAAEQLQDALKKHYKGLVKRQGNDIFEIATGDEYSVRIKILGLVK